MAQSITICMESDKARFDKEILGKDLSGKAIAEDFVGWKDMSHLDTAGSNGNASNARSESLKAVTNAIKNFDWEYEIFHLDNILRNMLIAGSIGATAGGIVGGIYSSILVPGLGALVGVPLGAYTGAIVGGSVFCASWVIFQYNLGSWIANPQTIIAPWASSGKF